MSIKDALFDSPIPCFNSYFPTNCSNDIKFANPFMPKTSDLKSTSMWNPNYVIVTLNSANLVENADSCHQDVVQKDCEPSRDDSILNQAKLVAPVNAKNDQYHEMTNSCDETGEKILQVNDKSTGNSGTRGKKEEDLQPLTWRGKLKNFLHSKPCHIAVIVLVLIDCILVITEILIDLKIVEVHEESPAPEIVHYMSISILSIFMIEITAKLIADWHHFWSHKMEIFDAVVVVIAFAFDIAVLFFEEEALIAIGLLILLRLWRVVRIVNGIILTVKNEGDERVHALKDKLKTKEEEIQELKEKLEKMEKKNEKLKEILAENGIHIEADASESEQNNSAVLTLGTSDNVISIDT